MGTKGLAVLAAALTWVASAQESSKPRPWGTWAREVQSAQIVAFDGREVLRRFSVLEIYYVVVKVWGRPPRRKSSTKRGRRAASLGGRFWMEGFGWKVWGWLTCGRVQDLLVKESRQEPLRLLDDPEKVRPTGKRSLGLHVRSLARLCKWMDGWMDGWMR